MEVASAGVGSPLKFPRQYRKNLGRKLEVISSDVLKFMGELTHVKEDAIELQWKQREPKPIGKGKVTVVAGHVPCLHQTRAKSLEELNGHLIPFARRERRTVIAVQGVHVLSIVLTSKAMFSRSTALSQTRQKRSDFASAQ